MSNGIPNQFTVDELPLLSRTPLDWARSVLAEPVALLGDHAYLEKKAAANALEMLNRWPEPKPPRRWVLSMAAIARDESAHLLLVCKLLRRMGGRLPRNHANPYAAELRKLVRKGDGHRELVDRLLISALIEARSCERFCVLANVADDPALVKLYAGLFASENGHFKTFLELASQAVKAEEVAERWKFMLASEAEILARQPAGPRMHSGF